MGLTVTLVSPTIVNKVENIFSGSKVDVYLDVLFDSSHADGGETFDLSKYMSKVLSVVPVEDSDGYIVAYKPAASWAVATGKLQVYTFDYDAVADGPAIKATGVDLSSLTVRIKVEGIR